MANALHPTAANIISSLGIRGATADQKLPGFVPVLDGNGMLSAKFIPSDAAQISIPAISNVAYVDPYTSVAEDMRKGSVVAPFKSISEAAAKFVPTEYAKAAKCIAFVLAPGNYADTSVAFPSGFAPLNVYFIGVGRCKLTQSRLVVSGFGSSEGGPKVLLQGIVTNGEIAFGATPTVTCVGETYVHEMTFSGSGATLRLSADSRVDSTNSGTVLDLIADARHVEFGTNDTVEDAINRLLARRIRTARVTQGSAGFDIASSFEDIPATLAGGYEVYDISQRDRMFAEGINSILKGGRFTTLTAETVNAKTVLADEVAVKTLRMDSLAMGGYRLEIDPYGYLVVSDEQDGPPRPPDGVVLLRDIVNGEIYVFSVSDGRLMLAYAEHASSDSSDSSSPSGGYIMDEMFLTDPDTGTRYRIYVESGRMMISVVDDSSS